MIRKRLKAITLFITLENKVVDVGCDHGLLSIYLFKNKLCKSIIASDVNENALSNAIKNIQKEKLVIKTYLSDGIKNIPSAMFDTIVISGMGTSTILRILNDNKKYNHVNKIILQSNNEHYKLRKTMNKKGFYLQNENVVKDGKKYYVTMLFVRDKRKNTNLECKYGLVKEDKKEYYQYLIEKYKFILDKIPKRKFLIIYKYKKKIYELNLLYKKDLEFG